MSKKISPKEIDRREKIRTARLGRKHSPETIEKIRMAMAERSIMLKMGLIEPYRHSASIRRKLKKIARGRKVSVKAVQTSAQIRRIRKQDQADVTALSQIAFGKAKRKRRIHKPTTR